MGSCFGTWPLCPWALGPPPQAVALGQASKVRQNVPCLSVLRHAYMAVQWSPDPGPQTWKKPWAPNLKETLGLQPE